MARFTHPGISGYGTSENGSWIIEGGTLGTSQPTFSGDPLFAGHYTTFDGLCKFSIDVDFDNITDFGDGQYYLKLPFPVHDNIIFSDGCLHDDTDQYAILGHVDAGSDIMKLFSIASNGRHVPFSDSDNQPVRLNALEDNFHISGTYEMDH